MNQAVCEVTPPPLSYATSQFIRIDQISLPEFQPRRYFNEEAMQQLIASVREHGILQPLLVRAVGAAEYSLVAGERRYKAARAVGLAEVPVVVLAMTATEALQVALLENLQREDLNAIEETEGILQLLALNLECDVELVPQLLYRLRNKADKSSLPLADSRQNVLPTPEADELEKVKSVFDRLGRMSWESFVKSRLSLLNLPSELLDAVRTERIEYTKAQAIARVEDKEQRLNLLSQAIAEKWSLSQIKQQIKSPLAEQLAPTPVTQPHVLFNRLESIYKRIKPSIKKNQEIWQNPQTQEKMSALLTELEALLC